MSSPIVLIGLGNPGARFDGSRHNVGFQLVDALARALGCDLRTRLFKPLEVGVCRKAGVILAKPLTYMNRSGRVIPWLLRRFSASLDHLIVVVDNMDLPPGEIRMKRRGGSTTHNGLKSIDETLASTEYSRLYIGVGRPASGESVIDHVLGTFDREERASVDDAIRRIVPVLVESASSFHIDRLVSGINALRRAL